MPESAREVLDSGRLTHLATINPDGSPHVQCVWVRAEGDEVVYTSMRHKRHVRNVERDPRAVISIPTGRVNAEQLEEYLVVEGRVRVIHGGGRDTLLELARVYLGPEADFPLPHIPGYVLRLTPDRYHGVGPWVEG
jgi:PPOX class probable F420-dependent enzyme